jgi:hypothetical protein
MVAAALFITAKGNRNMKTIYFALAGAATLALAACNNTSDQDTLPANMDDTYQQTDQLNDLAADAANQVDESDTLGNQAEELNNSAPVADTTTDTNSDDTVDDEAVNGM